MAKLVKPKYDLFISYAKQDLPFVDRLVHSLEAEDINVWYDRGSLRLGEDFSRGIQEALEQSRNFLLVISPDYVSSPWANFEMGVALSHDPAARARSIIPLFVREVDRSALPPRIAQTPGIFARDLTVEQIAEHLAGIIKPGNKGRQAS